MKLKKLLTEAFEGISGNIVTPRIFGQGEGFHTSPKKQIKEGPSYEYASYIKKIEKAEKQHGKEVDNLVKLLKKKGLNKEATKLASNYNINVKRDFTKFLEYLHSTLV